MTREEILNAAKQCVCQDRNDQYGSCLLYTSDAADEI